MVKPVATHTQEPLLPMYHLHKECNKESIKNLSNMNYLPTLLFHLQGTQQEY